MEPLSECPTWITVTVYSTSHSGCTCCAVSRSTRGFGPRLRGAKGRPSRRSIIAIHSGLPSGQPMVGARSIRVVVASVGMARSAAKSGSVRVTAPPLRAHHPRPRAAPEWIEGDVTGRRQQMRLVHHHRPKATLEEMAYPPEASVDRSGVAPVRFGKGRPQPVRVRWRHAKWA
jgi:hypothetical protein